MKRILNFFERILNFFETHFFGRKFGILLI